MGNLSIDASTPATVYSTTAPVTTASFTPPANSRLIIEWCGNTATATTAAAPSITDNLGVHLTYTLLQHSQRADGSPTCDRNVTAFTATVATSQAMTISVTTTAGASWLQSAIKVWVLTDDSGQTPGIGASAKGAQASGGAVAASLTATAAGSWAFACCDDWDAGGIPTAGTGTTVSAGDSADQGTVIAYAFGRRTTADGSAGVTTTVNFTAGTSANLGWVVAEVLPAASTTAASPPQTLTPYLLLMLAARTQAGWPQPSTAPGGIITARTATVSESASATAVTGTLPADIVAGDYVVATFHMSCSVAQFTGPGGSWVQIVAPTANTTVEIVAVYGQFSPASGPTGTTSAVAGRQTCIVQAYGRVDTGTPVDVAAITTVATLPLTLSSITTVTDGARLISGATADYSTGTWTFPAGMTAVANHSSGVGRGAAYADEVRATAGATGTRQWSASNLQAAVGYLFALRPASSTATAETGLAPVGLTTTGTAVHVGQSTGPAPLGLAATGIARKVAPAAGSAPAGVTTTGTARKVVAQSGACAAGLTTRGTAARRQAQTGAAPLGITGTGTAVHVGRSTGSAPLGVTAVGTAAHIGRSNGSAPLGVATTGTARHLGQSTGTAPLAAATTGAARKVAPQAARAPLAVSTTAAARKVGPQAGSAPLGVAPSGTDRKVAPQAGPVPLAVAARGSVTKVAVSSGPAPLAVTATGTAVRRAPAAGTAPVGLATYSTSAAVPRQQAGVCAVGIGASGTARRVAPQTGRAPLAAGTTGAAGKRAPAAGTVPLAAATRTAAAPGHGAAGRAPLGVTMTGTARKVAAGAGVAPLGVTGAGRVVKRATPGGTAPLPLTTVGGAVTKRVACRGVAAVGLTASLDPSKQARPVAGRTPLALAAWHKSRITRRPYAGTTARPDTGTTARPSSGTTARPSSGVTVRPYTGVTIRP